MVQRFQRLGIAVCAALLVWVGAQRVAAQQSAEQAGEASVGLSILQISTSELMAMEPSPLPEAAASAIGGPGTNLTIGPNFTALTLAEISATPPDGYIAAGPTQVIVISNGRLISFSRSTGARDNVLNLTPNAFFTLVRAGGSVFGGRIRFDSATNRWFITMATDATPGRVVIAVSNSATISSSTVWNLSAFDNTFNSSSCRIDGPTLGLDASALYVGVNQFCQGAYWATSGFVVRKNSTYTGSAPQVTRFDLAATATGAGPFAPMGVDNADGSSTSGYFIGVDNTAFGRLVLRRVTNPGAVSPSVPTISSDISLVVAATALPISVRHNGNTGGEAGHIAGLDDRLTSATLRNGRIWTAHAIGVDASGNASAYRNGVRWYEIGSVDSSPSLVQSGTIFASTAPGSLGERNYWNPSLAVTSTRAVLGFNTAGSGEFVNAGVAERLSTDALGTFGTPTLYTSSAAAYNLSSTGDTSAGRRWGNYSATVADSCDGSTVWALQQYVNATDSYALQVAKLVNAVAPPTPVSVAPAVVARDRASIDITVTASGAGALLDSSLSCRLGASIAGVTVNSVTYLSPTSARLNISTTGAALGARTITLTNPDGQSATSSSALLTVVESSQAMAVDMPFNNTNVNTSFTVSGWALDQSAASGTGVDTLHIWAFPSGSSAGQFLAVPTYGLARPDIGNSLGSQFTNSGFTANVSLTPGQYLLLVYAHSTVTGQFGQVIGHNITVTGPQTQPATFMDQPAVNAVLARSQPFTISGWALDRGSTTGTGVTDIHVWAFAPGGVGPGQFVGVATYNQPRTDVGAAYGDSRFNNCGYTLTVNANQLAAGQYLLVAFGNSTVTGGFTQSVGADITITGP
jgi:hypothetical protein